MNTGSRMSTATIERQAPHLKPVVVKYGKPTAKVGAPGGWELHVTARGTVKGTLNSSAAAYDAVMRSSILPKPKNLNVPKPIPKTVAIPVGPRVLIGAAVGVDQAIDKLTTQMVFSELRDKREAEEEDLEAAAQIASSAQQAAARAATRIRQKTMTKRKNASRIVIHGYSRRHGTTVKEFKRKSPRR